MPENIHACPVKLIPPPQMYTDMGVSTVKPDHATGWEAAPGTEETFDVPDQWKAGRIWGRKECDFSKEGAIACATGSCNGGLECDSATGTGVPPASVAEWTLSGDGDADWYDGKQLHSSHGRRSQLANVSSQSPSSTDRTSRWL